ncbi:major outer membrane protein [Campylobacter sp. VTCC 70190]|uniref:major outer membrane protein n=1 Tax=Campylobacter sp. VTCC 70190 TaxID=3392118 RepID=UPI00398EBB1C
MKKFRLSLCALVILPCVTNLNAASLDEAIKDIEVGGIMRYRYYFGDGDNKGGNENRKIQYWGGIASPEVNQYHHWRTGIGARGNIADNFKATVHFEYSDGTYGYGNNSQTNTGKSFALKQIYLTYDADATQVKMGRQYVDTIWVSPSWYKSGLAKDFYGGLIGTGVIASNTSIEGLTLNSYIFDSVAWGATGLSQGTFNNQVVYGDYGSDVQSDVGSWIARKNFYAASALGSYEVAGGGKLNPQFWLGYLPDRATLYAGILSYELDLSENVSYVLTGTYLGNSVDSFAKQRQGFKNGNFFQLDGSLTYEAWDAGAGVVRYGDSKEKTFTIIEDQGNLNIPAGYNILYTNGSRLNGDIGRNTFGYLTGGYSFYLPKKLRLGAEFIYGGTLYERKEAFKTYKVENGVAQEVALIGQGGKKYEYRLTATYNYSPKLTFSAFYANLNVDRKTENANVSVARFQAFYKF